MIRLPISQTTLACVIAVRVEFLMLCWSDYNGFWISPSTISENRYLNINIFSHRYSVRVIIRNNNCNYFERDFHSEIPYQLSGFSITSLKIIYNYIQWLWQFMFIILHKHISQIDVFDHLFEWLLSMPWFFPSGIC